MRNDCDRAAIAFQLGDGQADPLDADGAFGNSVAFNFRRNLDPQPPVFGISNALQSNQFAHAIDVSLHDVAAKSALSFHGELKIHQRALFYSGERSPGPRFRSKIGRKRFDFYIESRETHTTDGDAVSRVQLPRRMLCINSDVAVLASLLDARTATSLLMQSMRRGSCTRETASPSVVCVSRLSI